MAKWNARGFSLIEVMIATAIGTIVAAGSMAMLSRISSQQQVLQSRFDRADLDAGLRTQLFSIGTCGCNLKGLKFNTSTAGIKNGFAVPALRTYNSDCTASQDLATVGRALPGTKNSLKVEKIQMSDGFTVNPSTYVFTLNASLSNPSIGAIKPVSVANVYVKTKDLGAGNQEVIACTTSAMPDVIKGQCYQVTCTAMSGVTRTISATGGTNGNFLTMYAPSGQGQWVVEVRDGQIGNSMNCFSDQAMAAGSVPTYTNQSICQVNSATGRNCTYFGTCTYVQGGGSPFQTCSYKPC